MNRLLTFAVLSQIPSAFLDDFQDQVAALAQLSGTWVGRRPNLSYDGAALKVGANQGLILGPDGATATLLPGSATEVTVATAGLVTDTWYYVYAKNGGTFAAPTLAYEFSTTAPEASLTFKTGDNTRRYVGPFRTYTNAGTKIKPFRMVNGLCVYRLSGASVATTTILSAASGSGTAPCDPVVPPHARLAWLNVRLLGTTPGGGGTPRATFATHGDGAGLGFEVTTDTIQLAPSIAAGIGYAIERYNIPIELAPLAGLPTFDYTTGAAWDTIDVWLAAFAE